MVGKQTGDQALIDLGLRLIREHHPDAYDKAVDLICRETSGYQELIHFLVSAIPDPLIAGMILGKYNRAKEFKIDFAIDRESGMRDIPEHEKTVLLYEDDPADVSSGGPEDLPDVPRYEGGYLILFLDGHIEQVPKADLHKLRWHDDR